MGIVDTSYSEKLAPLRALARKEKRSSVKGDILVNGQALNDEHFHQMVGYVGQKDTLVNTLTVYETVLYSFLLHSHPDMDPASKELHASEILEEFGLSHIKDSMIGDPGIGISNIDRRKLLIACELVPGRSILFLDGLMTGMFS